MAIILLLIAVVILSLSHRAAYLIGKDDSSWDDLERRIDEGLYYDNNDILSDKINNAIKASKNEN